MPDNDTLGFRPSKRQRDLITRYQREEGSPDEPLKKSDALSNLVDMGLARYYGGLGDRAFAVAFQYALVVAGTLAVVWYQTGVGQVYTYVFLGVALGSLLVHLSDLNPVTWLTNALRRSGDERGA